MNKQVKDITEYSRDPKRKASVPIMSESVQKLCDGYQIMVDGKEVLILECTDNELYADICTTQSRKQEILRLMDYCVRKNSGNFSNFPVYKALNFAPTDENFKQKVQISLEKTKPSREYLLLEVVKEMNAFEEITQIITQLEEEAVSYRNGSIPARRFPESDEQELSQDGSGLKL